MEAERERLPEVDLLKALALLGVGVIHAGAWVTPAEAPPGVNAMAAASVLARFSVPAFVFASGFVLFHTYGSRPRRPWPFLRRRWSRVLLPWACCVPLFLALDALRGSPQLAARPVGEWLATGPGHLYFLVLIAQLYLLFLVLPRTPRRLAWTAAALAAAQLGLMAWRSYGSLPGGGLGYEEAPYWMGTFALGCLAGAEWPRLRRLASWWPVWMAVSVACGVLVLFEGQAIAPVAAHEGNGAYLWPSRLPQTVAWCLTALWLGRLVWPRLGMLRRLTAELGKHSLGVYLLHPIFLDLLGPHTAGLPAPARVPLLLAASFGGGYGAVRLLTLTRPTAVAVGEEPARPRPVAGELPLAA